MEAGDGWPMIWREDGLIDEEEEEEVVCVCAKPRGRIWADMPGKRSQVGKDEGKKVMENQVRWRGRMERDDWWERGKGGVIESI